MEILSLDLGLLHDNDVCFQDIEHGLWKESTLALRQPRHGPGPSLSIV